MAGYDFSFEIPFRYRGDVRNWLRYFQRCATMLDLEVSYRTLGLSSRRAQAHVTIDGSLAAMQHLYRQLPEAAIHFMIAVGKPTVLVKHVLNPFFDASEKGLKGITNFVFKTADMFGMEPARLAISTNLAEKAEVKGYRSREGQAIQTIIRALDGWLSGSLSPKDTVILCDQGMEDWLKAQLKLPSRSREGFHHVVGHALQRALINPAQAYRLRRFHATRNRVQHRGGRVRTQTVLSMLSYSIRLIDSISKW